MKTLFSILLLALATTGQSAGTLYSFKVPVDGLASNGVIVTAPGKTNALQVVFSPNGGLCPTNVTLSSEAGSYIFYTLDGSTPTTGSSMVSHGQTVTMTSAGVIKALSWRNDIYTIASVVTTSAAFTNAPAAPAEGFTLTGENTDTTGHDYRLIGVSDTTRYQWTIITPSVTTNLSKFALLMGAGLSTPTGYLTGLVHAVSGSTPTSTQLGISAAVNASILEPAGASNWVEFTLTSPISVTASTKIALGVTRDTTAFGEFPVAYTPDAFVLTGCWQTTNTTEFVDSASRQLNFKTYSSP